MLTAYRTEFYETRPIRYFWVPMVLLIDALTDIISANTFLLLSIKNGKKLTQAAWYTFNKHIESLYISVYFP